MQRTDSVIYKEWRKWLHGEFVKTRVLFYEIDINFNIEEGF